MEKLSRYSDLMLLKIRSAKRVLAAVLVVAGTAIVVTAIPAAAAPAQRWCFDTTGIVRESSPLVVDLDGGGADVVVGTNSGLVYAVHGSDGSAVPGWPQQTTDGINSSASAADTDGDGMPELFIGSGLYTVRSGALYSFEHDGRLRFRYNQSDPDFSSLSFHSAPAIGDVTRDGVADVTAGALGLLMPSLSHTGSLNAGWPFFADDTQFASPALADVNGDGQTDIIIGHDASPGGRVDHRGGIMRAMTGGGQTIWEFRIDEMIRSSPAVGDITGDGVPEIVFGAGDYWVNQPGGARDSTKVFALRLNGTKLWERDTGGLTISAPALADVDGDGRRDVAIGTFQGGNPGRIFVLQGTNGADVANFPQVSPGGVIVGGIVTADLNSDGGQDLLVPGVGWMFAFSGKTGGELFRLLGDDDLSYQNSAVVTDLDGNGLLDIVISGLHNIKGPNLGRVCRFELAPSDGGVLGALGWPMFRYDARRTGSLTNPPLTQTLCVDPNLGGYWMAASDGGIFAFCKAKFFGSAGGLPLAQPVVGMAPTPSGNGYWLVASDGGMFSYGDAKFFGSTGGMSLVQPVVGMVPTPSGKGYWLVARDGGMFAFGDATFFGSMGGKPLSRPVVGMAATPSGNGYWLVAEDGGIFAFGDAKFFSSTGGITLNQLVVGMAPTPSGNGYWFVARDGGIFAFGDAKFFGSTGGIRLNQPIVSMAATDDGRGYWLVASDGGIFAFGNAPFLGSTGSIRLARPIVDMASP